MVFDIGDKVIIKRKTTTCGVESDEGLVGTISSILNGSYQYEVDFGERFVFTHTGQNHLKRHYRYYSKDVLDLFDSDKFEIDDICIDEITILLNN